VVNKYRILLGQFKRFDIKCLKKGKYGTEQKGGRRVDQIEKRKRTNNKK